MTDTRRVRSFVESFKKKLQIVQTDPDRYGILVLLFDNQEELYQSMIHGSFDYSLAYDGLTTLKEKRNRLSSKEAGEP